MVRRTNIYPIIELRNITKRLGRYSILTNISFKVYRGERIGIAGPVGAGKTTLLYVLLGLITPDKGSVNIFGVPLKTHEQHVLQRVNFASSALKLNGYASIWENLFTFARLYRIRNPKQKIEQLAKSLHIEDLLKKNFKVYKLSAGENSKINICKALLNDPEILFLDEITAYLDPESIETFRGILKNNMIQTIVFASHNLRELKRFCTKILFLNKGRIQYIGPFSSAKKVRSFYE